MEENQNVEEINNTNNPSNDDVARKTVWRPRHDPSPVVKAIPPWADANAQPPPPLTSHYALWCPGTSKLKKTGSDPNIANKPPSSPKTKKKNKVRDDISAGVKGGASVQTTGHTASESSIQHLQGQSSVDISVDHKSFCSSVEMVSVNGAPDIKPVTKNESTLQNEQTPPWRKSEPAKDTHSSQPPWRQNASDISSAMVISEVSMQSSQHKDISQVTQQSHQLIQNQQNQQSLQGQQIKDINVVEDAPWRSPKSTRRSVKELPPKNQTQNQPNWRTNQPTTNTPGAHVAASNVQMSAPSNPIPPAIVAGPQNPVGVIGTAPIPPPPPINVASVSSVITSTNMFAPAVTATSNVPSLPPADLKKPKMNMRGSPKGSPILSRKPAPAPPQDTAPPVPVVPVVSTNTSIPSSQINSVNVVAVDSIATGSNIEAAVNVKNSLDKNEAATKSNDVSKNEEIKPNTSLSCNEKEVAVNSDKQSNINQTTSNFETNQNKTTSEVKKIEGDVSTSNQVSNNLPPPPPVSHETPEVIPEVVPEVETLPPPPPSLLHEELLSKSPIPKTLEVERPSSAGGRSSSGPSEDERPFEKDSPDYVPEPVTNRIQKFEKQRSRDREDHSRERQPPPPAKPVGPWVKRTSSGPCRHEGWTSPPTTEESDWPDSSDESVPFRQPPRDLNVSSTKNGYLSLQWSAFSLQND